MARRYTTVQGDTWDSIAYRLWGEERHLDMLLAINREYADTLIFPAGVVLDLPEPPAPKVKKMELPPWI